MGQYRAEGQRVGTVVFFSLDRMGSHQHRPRTRYSSRTPLLHTHSRTQRGPVYEMTVMCDRNLAKDKYHLASVPRILSKKMGDRVVIASCPDTSAARCGKHFLSLAGCSP